MRGNLRLVSSLTDLSAEGIVAEAVQPLAPGSSAGAIDARAKSLARDVVAIMRREEEPAILASVVLVIPDQAMKVAFLEAIGDHLI